MRGTAIADGSGLIVIALLVLTLLVLTPWLRGIAVAGWRGCGCGLRNMRLTGLVEAGGMALRGIHRPGSFIGLGLGRGELVLCGEQVLLRSQVLRLRCGVALLGIVGELLGRCRGHLAPCRCYLALG